jgi:hypothetical protein
MTLLQAAGKYSIAACNTLLFFVDYFDFACGVQLQKGVRYLSELKEKRTSNPFKSCNIRVIMCLFIILWTN